MDENPSSAEACLSLHAKTQDQNQSVLETFCPAVWDKFICWPPVTADTTASRPCPTVKGSDSTYKAFRICGSNGTWLDRDGLSSEVGWTNYTTCLTPELREIWKRLGSPAEAQKKLDIAGNTRILEFIGLSLSLTALILSLAIFHKFRTLRNSRTRLHRHLFVAMVIQVAIRLTLYIDQLVTRANSPQNKHPLSQDNLQGIHNTPFLCEFGYVCLEYARTAMFMWMFVEGLYLHNMITVTVFEEKFSHVTFYIVGWIVPIPLTAAWATVTALNYGSATCWWGYNFTLFFWILEGPRLGVLMVNLTFLLNILRVLVTKLRRSNSSEIHQARKAVKAALLLLPLLGLTNLLNMLHAPLEKAAWIFGLWSYSTHLLTSSQGFIVACLYCFNNGEVQLALKKYFRIKILGRNKVRIPKPSIRMSLLNHSLVAVGEERIVGTGIGNNSTTNRTNLGTVKKLTANQQQRLKRYNHLKCNNNNFQGNSSRSPIQNSTKDPSVVGDCSNERKGNFFGLQRLLSSSKNKSDSILGKERGFDNRKFPAGQDVVDEIESTSDETVRQICEEEEDNIVDVVESLVISLKNDDTSHV